jgi:hypothetical protein
VLRLLERTSSTAIPSLFPSGNTFHYTIRRRTDRKPQKNWGKPGEEDLNPIDGDFPRHISRRERGVAGKTGNHDCGDGNDYLLISSIAL